MARLHPSGVPRSIEYPEMPLYAFLENTSRKFPDRVAAYYLGRSVTYRETWNKAIYFAGKLKELGIEKGDCVGLLLPNTPQYIIALNGVLIAGGVAVPLNPLNPVEEIGRELSETECKITIILDRLIGNLPKESKQHIVVAKASEYAPINLRLLDSISNKVNLPGSSRFEDLTKGVKTEPAKICSREDIAAILYTSGTTGLPKGVMLTHFNLVANALQSYFWLRGWGYSPKPQSAGWPIILCAVPFFHSYGLNILNEAVSFGCTMALVPNPKPEAILEVVKRHKVTHMPLIPRFVYEIISHPSVRQYDFSSVAAASSGGAPIEVEQMRRFEELISAKFYQGYGLTEAGPATHASPVEGEPNYASAGLPYPDTECRVVDLQVGEVDMSPGKAGELLIRGPQVMKGYWKDPGETARALQGGWLHTGDVVKVDEAGWLYVMGRKRDKIVASGHTVWPVEVEEAMLSHPDVEMAVAVGAPDPMRCDTNIQAFVLLKRGVDPTDFEGKLMDLCWRRLQPYQVPGRIEIVPSLPLTPMGKVDRLAVEAEVERRLEKIMDEYALEGDSSEETL